MINFDDAAKKKIKEHNSDWLQIPDHQYRILVIGGSGSGDRNSLFNLVNEDQILIKFIYMLNIHMKQNIDF